MPALIPVVLSELQIRGLIEAANRAEPLIVNASLRRGADAGATKLEDALTIHNGGTLSFVRRTKPRKVDE